MNTEMTIEKTEVMKIREARVRTPMMKAEIEERLKNFNEMTDGYTAEQAMEEASRCLNCPARYCSASCPVHNNIPEFIARVKEGDFEGAYGEIIKANPLPEVCGRICPQEKQCERNCTRAIRGEATAIGRLERFVADYHRTNGSKQIRKPALSGKRIAVVGSGPSGLSAASRLAESGHEVTVFERSDRIGGLMVYGIPNMKLGKAIFQSALDRLSAQGVRFETNRDLGKNMASSELTGIFDAVVLCCGASEPRDLQVPGRNAKGVHYAVDYLRENTRTLLDGRSIGSNPLSARGKDVIVIGGGDTGNDCVATAIRQGCKSVVQLEMMPEEPDERIRNIPWTEFPLVGKTDYGQEEAIYLYGEDPRRFATTAKELVSDEQGNLKAVKTVRLETAFDNLKMKLIEISGSEEVLDCQMLLIAAGFTGSQKYVTEEFGVELNRFNNVKTLENSNRTNVEKIFTAGDMRNGQSVVARAINDGLIAAGEVDLFLKGE